MIVYICGVEDYGKMSIDLVTADPDEAVDYLSANTCSTCVKHDIKVKNYPIGVIR